MHAMYCQEQHSPTRVDMRFITCHGCQALCYRATRHASKDTEGLTRSSHQPSVLLTRITAPGGDGFIHNSSSRETAPTPTGFDFYRRKERMRACTLRGNPIQSNPILSDGPTQHSPSSSIWRSSAKAPRENHRSRHREPMTDAKWSLAARS